MADFTSALPVTRGPVPNTGPAAERDASNKLGLISGSASRATGRPVTGSRTMGRPATVTGQRVRP